jgi:ferrochelatase
VAAAGWKVQVRRVSGWHRHPAYVRLRANGIRTVLARNSLSLDDPRTRLVFSAHGTPIKYIDQGSRYRDYVEELARAIAAELGGVNYALAYQNHDNRPGVEWTQPDVDAVIRAVDADRVLVEPMSFMHEQSETLAELDHVLRDVAEGRGLAFHRVPVPHDAPEFIRLLADRYRRRGDHRAGACPRAGPARDGFRRPGVGGRTRRGDA